MPVGATLYSARPWLLGHNQGSDLERCSDASILNSRRFGHVGSIIDPNAVKASVSEWPDFISRSGRVYVGSRAERYERGLFLSHV